MHVTGGTNGILVDALRRHRPFTPSFVGRAQDQAYLLSVLGVRHAALGDRPGPRLAYAHAAGLIMRHDKDAFAGEAMAAAEAGKLIGDDVRILQFSALARSMAGSAAGQTTDAGWQAARAVKAILDPFTGCFVSRLPVTVVMLRFALRLAQAFDDGRGTLGLELAEIGAQAPERGPGLHEWRRATQGRGARAGCLERLLRRARCARARHRRRRSIRPGDPGSGSRDRRRGARQRRLTSVVPSGRSTTSTPITAS